MNKPEFVAQQAQPAIYSRAAVFLSQGKRIKILRLAVPPSSAWRLSQKEPGVQERTVQPELGRWPVPRLRQAQPERL
jgi:hypothetical protein